MAGLLHDVGHGPFAHFFDDHVLAAFEAPADPRRPDAKRLTHEDLSARIITEELGAAAARPAPRPGCRRRAGCLRRRRVDRSRVGRVPHRQARPGRPVDAALGPLAGAAAVGRVHRRQPRLRAPRRLPDRGRGGPDRRRTAAPLHVHRRRRADAVRAGARRARDLPHGPAVHVPAGLLPPDRAGDRPRPGRRLRAVGPGDLRRRLAGRAPRRLCRPRRVRPPPPGRPVGARRGRRAGRCGAPRRRATGGCRRPSPSAGGRSCCASRPGAPRPRSGPSTRPANGRTRSSPRSASPSRAAWPSTWPSSTPGRPRPAPPTGCSALEGRDGRALSLSSALASIPAYWLIGRRYRRR